MQTVNHIRKLFLDYFARQGHNLTQSAPLIPHNDPTLMFVNAGMVPFKDVFTQNEKRDYVRAASAQKCVRAGGKHNDLDNVGYTARHHTFFEMLGNFSFGDYFKEEAIYYAWELLTKHFMISPDKLLVTVYHDDDQAFNIWKKLTSFPDHKIIRIKGSDNFWMMGDTGPCGPCSEIFYDHGESIFGGPPGSKDQDGDRFVEIWNIVFMQFESLASGEKINLPKPSIDTGMGLERIAAVLQGVHDNYDIDLFKNLITQCKEISGIDNKEHHNSYRVIADHIRSTSFLLADGVMPSNEGRGYVLRRIMRRAMRHVKQLGYNQPLMYKLVPSLVQEMGESYPELQRAKNMIEEVLKLEEENFNETLDRGLKLLEKETANLTKGSSLAGDVAFKLYDTYGFPYDLTVDILRAREIKVDEEGFKVSMEEQKKKARAAWKGSGEQATDELWYKIKETSGATEFIGYDSIKAQANIVAIIKDKQQVDVANATDKVSIILNQTPFYGQSGGQEGDHGKLIAHNFEANVLDTTKLLGSLHVHYTEVKLGSIKVGDIVTAVVDQERRDKLRANHSATHILHAVLRQVLGTHVTQKGSLVAEDRLRFDISHPKPLSEDEKNIIELKVNQIIAENSKVETHLMSPEFAIKSGAMALFGEKYGDEVRVLSMGSKDKDNKAYSVELCGGTHVNRTGDIGLFKIVSESAIASGVRRIEAMTGLAAISEMQKLSKQLTDIANQMKVTPEQVIDRIEALNKERKNLEQELSKARKSAAMGGGSEDKIEKINGVGFCAKIFDDMPVKDLRDLAVDLQKKYPETIVVLASKSDGKVSFIIAIDDKITNKYNAANIIKEIAPMLGAGGGGGKPNFAQTGGTKQEVIEEAINFIKAKL